MVKKKSRKKTTKKVAKPKKELVLTEKDAKKIFLKWKNATSSSERDKMWDKLYPYANKYRDLFNKYNKPIAFSKK